MRQQLIYLLVMMGVLAGFSMKSFAATSQEKAASLEESTSVSSGTITTLDLEDRTIQINKHPYRLSDKMQIFSEDNRLLGEGALVEGQNIEFGLKEEEQPAGPKGDIVKYNVVYKIRILTGLKQPDQSER